MLEKKGTKQKILLIAMKLFGEFGYEKTSMRMIAEESGISKPAIYYYFPDKDSLFNGLIKYGIDHIQVEIKNIIDSTKPFREKLIDIIMSRFRKIPDHPSVSKFISQMIRGGIKFNMGSEYKDLFLKQSNTLYNLIQDAVDKGGLASLELAQYNKMKTVFY